MPKNEFELSVLGIRIKMSPLCYCRVMHSFGEVSGHSSGDTGPSKRCVREARVSGGPRCWLRDAAWRHAHLQPSHTLVLYPSFSICIFLIVDFVPFSSQAGRRLPCHGERSRSQLFFKLAGAGTRLILGWLFKFGCVKSVLLTL